MDDIDIITSCTLILICKTVKKSKVPAYYFFFKFKRIIIEFTISRKRLFQVLFMIAALLGLVNLSRLWTAFF